MAAGFLTKPYFWNRFKSCAFCLYKVYEII
jgi:hypothetical protein